MNLLATLILSAAALPASTLQQAPQPSAAETTRWAITHVNVVPAHREVVLKDQTVLLKDGRIEAIAPAAVLEVPEGYFELAADGKYLVPGYCDSHAHFPGKSGLEIDKELYLTMMLDNGITRLRCMRMEEDLPRWAERVEKGEVLGPVIHYPMAMLWSGNDLQGAKLRSILKKTATSGSYMKMLGGFEPNKYRAVLEIANDAGVMVAGHLPRSVDLQTAIDAGQIGIEHFHGFGRDKEIKAKQLEHGLKISEAAGIFHCPTIFWSTVQGMHIPMDQLNQLAGLDRVPQELQQKWKTFLTDPNEQEWRDRVRSYNPNMMRVLRGMANTNANLLLSASDGDFVIPGYSFHEEIKLYKSAGITPFQILQAATYNAARFFKATNEWGSIQPGLRADLVLINGNPLADPANLSRVTTVFVGGICHFP